MNKEQQIKLITAITCLLMGIGMLVASFITICALKQESEKVIFRTLQQESLMEIYISIVVLGILSVLFSMAAYLMFEKPTRKN